jgi:hypothetical protein
MKFITLGLIFPVIGTLQDQNHPYHNALFILFVGKEWRKGYFYWNVVHNKYSSFQPIASLSLSVIRLMILYYYNLNKFLP